VNYHFNLSLISQAYI